MPFVLLVSALVSSRFDYANCVIYFGCPQKHRPIVFSDHRAHLYESWHSGPLVPFHCYLPNFSDSSIHWMPIESPIKFKLTSLTFKPLHTAKLSQYHKAHEVHALDHLPLTLAPRHLSFDSRAFRISAQKYGIPCRLTFCSLKHSLRLDVIWRPSTFS